MNKDKHLIREKINSARKNLPEKSQKSKAIIETLKKLDEFKTAKTIMPYLSLDIEVDTKEFIKNELSEQKRTVLVPFIEKDNIQISKLSDFKALTQGKFGVLEPLKKEICNEKIDIIIVPGVAFDKHGSRIGFGKGYYDRFLEKYKNSLKIGLAFEDQLVNFIPKEQHDKPVDIIITEKRVVRYKNG